MSYNRKDFLKTSAVLIATAVTGSSFTQKKSKPRLGFSTIACPDWSFGKITDFANRHGFNGIEMRGLNGELNLTKCPEFSTPENVKATKRLMKQKQLVFTDLGSSAKLHFTEGAEREQNLAEARAYIDLAEALDCRFVRVFPNEFPKDQDRELTMGLVSKGLLALGEYAKGRNVTVLMETHGDFSRSHDIEKVMRAAQHPNVGLVWDVSNMWTVTKESPKQVYKTLAKYIYHTHIKDAKLIDGKIQYVFLGQGDVPIFEAIDILEANKFKGYYSFEWEKLWHKDLADPELAVADYARKMKDHFGI